MRDPKPALPCFQVPRLQSDTAHGMTVTHEAAIAPVPCLPYPRPMTDTSRLDELEIRIAHQDQTIEDLNAAVTAQWKLIDKLERKIALLDERLLEAEQSVGQEPAVDRPPPHY